MTRKRITNVMTKEWQVVFSDIGNVLFVSLLPLLIVGQGTAYIWLAAHFGGDALLPNSMIAGALAKLREATPIIASLPDADQLQVLLLSQFNFYLLLIPTMIAINFATFSIVDEKLSGSLEPLLATPVKTWELLLGKALSGIVPAMLVTWASYVAFLALVAVIGWGHLLAYVLTPSSFIAVFLLTPAVAALSFILGVLGSSRARDSKSAQNFAVFIVLPVLALIGIQVTGLVWFTSVLALALTLAVVVVDILTLRVAVRLFQRESILTKWR